MSGERGELPSRVYRTVADRLLQTGRREHSADRGRPLRGSALPLSGTSQSASIKRKRQRNFGVRAARIELDRVIRCGGFIGAGRTMRFPYSDKRFPSESCRCARAWTYSGTDPFQNQPAPRQLRCEAWHGHNVARAVLVG
jgi:hypothetical protein